MNCPLNYLLTRGGVFRKFTPMKRPAYDLLVFSLTFLALSAGWAGILSPLETPPMHLRAIMGVSGLLAYILWSFRGHIKP